MRWRWCFGRVAVAVTLVLATHIGGRVRADAGDGSTAGGDTTRPVLVTTAAVLVLGTGAAGLAYGVWALAEAPACVQTSPMGVCLQVREPTEESRLYGLTAIVASTVTVGLGVVLAVLADEAWQAANGGHAAVQLRPWFQVGLEGANAGLSWVW